ncbi:MAG TPA: SpaA isopeptide-forming pilin-related protein, partial [Methanothrix sp.]|nr:SpaA isopeptide-forming pilin-related protein [Methanothrix sp.]
AEAPAVVEPVVAEAVAVNETEVVAEAPAVNETEVAAAAPVAGPYVIMGMAQDNDQAPLEGWNFNLSKDGSVVDSATSGVDGKFNFVGLTSGVYTVTETLEEGWSAVSPENGTVDVTIADASVTDLVFVNQKA